MHETYISSLNFLYEQYYESIRQHFGEILSELRNDKGLNQNELAKHFNLSKSSIEHYEQGDNFPSPSVVAGISEFFHVPIDYLYGLITHSLEYEKLNENFTQNYTYGDVLKKQKTVCYQFAHRFSLSIQ